MFGVIGGAPAKIRADDCADSTVGWAKARNAPRPRGTIPTANNFRVGNGFKPMPTLQAYGFSGGVTPRP